MKNNSTVIKSVKPMSGWGTSYEIAIPPEFYPILYQNSKLPHDVVVWLNEKRNIEISSNKKECHPYTNGILTVSPIRKHGGSVVFTIPHVIRKTYVLLNIKFNQFTIFVNTANNIEFQPHVNLNERL